MLLGTLVTREAICALVKYHRFKRPRAALYWQTYHRELDPVVKRIALEEIRAPSVAINSGLHDLRRDFENLRKELSMTHDWMPPRDQQEVKSIKNRISGHIGDPAELLKQTLVESSILAGFLMDSFMLHLSSVSAREADTNAKMTPGHSS